MENEEPKSAEEVKLPEWLAINNVYPGQEEMQSMLINSFYSQFEEEPDDDELVPLDEVDLDMSEGFGYKAYEKSDEEEKQAWDQKISYALNNPERFLSYINDMWH